MGTRVTSVWIRGAAVGATRQIAILCCPQGHRFRAKSRKRRSVLSMAVHHAHRALAVVVAYRGTGSNIRPLTTWIMLRSG